LNGEPFSMQGISPKVVLAGARTHAPYPIFGHRGETSPCQQALMAMGPRVRGDDKNSPGDCRKDSEGRLFSNCRGALKLAFPEESASDAHEGCGELKFLSMQATGTSNSKAAIRILCLPEPL
jgi:hypothetical protein